MKKKSIEKYKKEGERGGEKEGERITQNQRDILSEIKKNKFITKKELKFILQEGEGLKIEFKENIGGIDKEIVAFANTNGGRIFLGIDDKNNIKGINITNKLKSQIQDIARNCDPSIKINLEEFCTQGVPSNNLKKVEGKNILIINVEEGKNKPYKCSQGFYLRQGANSQKMTRDEIFDFAISEGKIKFDERINNDFIYPNDFDENKLNNYLNLAKISKIISNEKTLAELNITKNNTDIKFNNTGVLFFAKEPQRFISWSVFTVVLFKDKGGADIIDRKEITGSLFEIVDKVMDFVKLYSKVAYKFTGKPQRENVYEYSFEAIREAVINSVMHKNYFEHGHNNILKFFPDRIQIENIWIKPKSFILGKTVYRRNRIIADLFSKIHFGEKIGSGVERMKLYCKKEKAPFPEIRFTDTHFYVVFKPSRAYIERAEGLAEGLAETQKKIISLISKNKKISRAELAKKIEISQTAIYKNIARLKQKNLLRRIGSAKGGHWKVIKK